MLMVAMIVASIIDWTLGPGPMGAWIVAYAFIQEMFG